LNLETKKAKTDENEKEQKKEERK